LSSDARETFGLPITGTIGNTNKPMKQIKGLSSRNLGLTSRKKKLTSKSNSSQDVILSSRSGTPEGRKKENTLKQYLESARIERTNINAADMTDVGDAITKSAKPASRKFTEDEELNQQPLRISKNKFNYINGKDGSGYDI